LRGSALEQHAPLEPGAADLLRDRVDRGLLSVRGSMRLRAVALTLADLEGRDGPVTVDDVLLAECLRAHDVLPGTTA